MINILNLSYNELEEFLLSLNENKSSFEKHTQNIWKALWHLRVSEYKTIQDIPLKLKSLLEKNSKILLPKVILRQKSTDGTEKILLELADKNCIEMVLIPNLEGKITLCISSQVACKMACTFCATGKNPFKRNLSSAEILSQVLVAKNTIADSLQTPRIKNIVFMGMGEPFLNMHELIKSLRILNSPTAFMFTPRSITVSTCGIADTLPIFAKEKLAYLAFSLHAPNQKLREKIMPFASKWALDNIKKELINYPLSKREYISLEYLLLEHVNDTVEHAKELADFAKACNAKINLIIFNEHENCEYKTPSDERIQAFRAILLAENITAIIRQRKGADIDAACGQLQAKLL